MDDIYFSVFQGEIIEDYPTDRLHCGERLYTEATIKRFEKIRAKLAREETHDFQPMGQAFQVNS